MHTQPSSIDTSFSPFRPGLKFESTDPTADPPDGGGGTGGGTTPTDPPEDDEQPPQ